MENQLEYEFPAEQQAYRFLNTVSHLEAEKLNVRFGRSGHHVLVKYRYASGEFDSMASTLDDLAREMEGQEVR